MKKVLLGLVIGLGAFYASLNSQNTWTADYDFDWQFQNEKIESQYLDKTQESLTIAISEPFTSAQIHRLELTTLEYTAVPENLLRGLDLNQVEDTPQIDSYSIDCSRSDCELKIKLKPMVLIDGVVQLLERCEFVATYDFITEKRGDYTDKSILSEGNVYGFTVADYGLYEIDKSILEEQKLQSAIDQPKTIKIYGTYGGFLPGRVSAERVDDLREIPLVYDGLEDGSFDEGDRILVYLEGPQRLEYQDMHLYKHQNPYGDKIRYFLKYGGANAQTVKVEEEETVSEEHRARGMSVFQHENEEINMLNHYKQFGVSGSGRNWVGEFFSANSSQSIPLNFSADPNTEVETVMAFYGRDLSTQEVKLKYLGKSDSKSISRISSHNKNKVSQKVVLKLTNDFVPNSNLAKISYTASGNGNGFLDYISCNYYKSTSENNGAFFFTSHGLRDGTNTSFNSSASLHYLNVTDLLAPHFEKKDNDKIHVKAGLNAAIYVFNKSADFPRISALQRVPNQNLHSIHSADMLIIHNPLLEAQAQRLAEHREAYSNLLVKTVSSEKIFNEFGRGMPTPLAIRDFVKMIFDRDENFKYLLILGDGTFDIRNILEDPNHKYTVPSFITNNSSNYISSFSTDDYYALLNNNEGGINSLKGALDIGVGRLPANSEEQADEQIDKIIRYDTDPNTLGSWRLRAMFVGDDEDFNTHMRQANKFADKLRDEQANFNPVKVLADGFTQVSSAGGDRYPDASKKILDNFSRGVSILNYMGHGSPKRWSQEKLFTIEDIAGLNNYDRLPLVITATCTFAPFDDPFFESAGEKLLNNTAGGAIAIFSTLRPVYSSSNEILTNSIFSIITDSEPSELSFGNILRKGKNFHASDTLNTNARKFVLLGDPAQRLNLPELELSLSSINDISRSDFQDTLKALDHVKISGYVHEHGNIQSDFNGILEVKIYDKPVNRTTLGQDQGSTPMEYLVEESVIYSGQASVHGGEFTFEFVLPKDIDFQVGKGKVSMYAYDSESNVDAMGFDQDISIGGISDNTYPDLGPEIKLFLNDTLFVNYMEVSKDPMLLAHINDDIGVSVSGQGIGHDLIAYLDGDKSEQFVLNEYYNTDLDVSTSGTVNYPLADLEEGEHSLTLRAWDVANNFTEETIYFRVGNETNILSFKAYPNPFNEELVFRLHHNLIGEAMELDLEISDCYGRLIYTESREYQAAPSVIEDFSWGNAIQQSEIQDGLYFARMILRLSDETQNLNSKIISNTIRLIHHD